MPIDERTFIVSSNHRDESSDTSNDVTVTLPDSIFSGKVEAINLRHMYVDYSVETLGTSNYQFYVRYPAAAQPRLVSLAINDSSSDIVRTDDNLAALIALSINAAVGDTVFNVFHNQIMVSTGDIYRDNCDTLSSFSIFTSNSATFGLDFSMKSSLGPLIGFGNGTYSGSHSYTGGNIQAIWSYEAIHVSNKAYDPIYKNFDISTDVACKMDLYDSNDQLISNYLDQRDTTISLPIAEGYIYSTNELARLLSVELNRYSASFSGAPTFSTTFDPNTYRFTISTTPPTRFGIGFRFNRTDGANNYGSMHRQLGFSKRIYLGYTAITSTAPAKIFDRSYNGEYLFVCSDLIKYNYDVTLIVTESAGRASLYESVFTIPIAQIAGTSYVPAFETEHRLRIHASRLAKLYNEDRAEAKTINFYLKLSTGRHIKLDTQWSLMCEIEYTN